MAKSKQKINYGLEFKRSILRRVGEVVAFLFITALVLFASAGTVNWPYAWLYMAVSLAIIITNLFIMSPELVAERGRKKGNVERWDSLLSSMILVPWLGIYLVAGLDYRWEWSPAINVGWHLAGMVFYVLGNMIAVWAMMSNPFFSTAVRIEPEKGQTVCSGGPYRYVRHPGYVGMLIYMLASPFFLGSLWAELPAFLTAVLFVVRTWLEDRALHQKLPGYQEYASNTRFRLIPGLW